MTLLNINYKNILCNSESDTEKRFDNAIYMTRTDYGQKPILCISTTEFCPKL